MLERVTEENKDMFLLGDFNINWSAPSCPLRKKISSSASACCLSQMITIPTRVTVNAGGHRSSSCIDHIYTNVPEHCSNIVSIPVGYSDHNLVGLTKKMKPLKTAQKIIFHRSYKNFNADKYINDVKEIHWTDICLESDPDMALSMFIENFCYLADKHAPLKRFTVKKNYAPWLDNELNVAMSERDIAKAKAHKSVSPQEWARYRELRNQVTKLNRRKKKEYYQLKLKEANKDSKKVWKVLNNIMGRDLAPVVSHIYTGGTFISNCE